MKSLYNEKFIIKTLNLEKLKSLWIKKLKNLGNLEANSINYKYSNIHLKIIYRMTRSKAMRMNISKKNWKSKKIIIYKDKIDYNL